MKTIISLILTTFICTYAYSQRKLGLYNEKRDNENMALIDSTSITKTVITDKSKVTTNNSSMAEDKQSGWTDFNVPITSAISSGSNAPAFSSFVNNGAKFTGSALYFNGIDQYDSIPANKKLDFTNSDFSVSFWIQPESGTSKTTNSNIIYKKGRWNISILDKKIRVYLKGSDVFFSGVELNMDARNFVVVSLKNYRNGSCLLVWINNKFAGRQVNEYAFGDNASAILIGKAENKGYGDNYKGVLDELNIWKKYLSQEERDSLWNDSKGTEKIIAAPSHIAGYSFNDKNAPELTDNDAATNIKAYTLNKKTTPVTVNGLISENIISHGIFAYLFDKNKSEELFFNIQVPQTWIEGSQSEWQVHYTRPVNDTGTVVWGLEYTWTNIGEHFSETKTIYSYDNNTSDNGTYTSLSFGIQDGTGKKAGSMISCRIFRDGNSPKDTYNHDVGLLEIDFQIKSTSQLYTGLVPEIK